MPNQFFAGMAEDGTSSNSLLLEAIEVWKNAQRVFLSGAWKGRPREGHLIEVLAARKNLESELVKLLDHEDELVVGYVLATLRKMDSASLDRLPQRLFERQGTVDTILGSFAVEYSLGQFAAEIQQEWREKRKRQTS